MKCCFCNARNWFQRQMMKAISGKHLEEIPREDGNWKVSVATNCQLERKRITSKAVTRQTVIFIGRAFARKSEETNWFKAATAVNIWGPYFWRCKLILIDSEPFTYKCSRRRGVWWRCPGGRIQERKVSARKRWRWGRLWPANRVARSDTRPIVLRRRGRARRSPLCKRSLHRFFWSSCPVRRSSMLRSKETEGGDFGGH